MHPSSAKDLKPLNVKFEPAIALHLTIRGVRPIIYGAGHLTVLITLMATKKPNLEFAIQHLESLTLN